MAFFFIINSFQENESFVSTLHFSNFAVCVFFLSVFPHQKGRKEKHEEVAEQILEIHDPTGDASNLKSPTATHHRCFLTFSRLLVVRKPKVCCCSFLKEGNCGDGDGIGLKGMDENIWSRMESLHHFQCPF